jgi:outer membrane protein OmpA-like peptidoglycan-associated protein
MAKTTIFHLLAIYLITPFFFSCISTRKIGNAKAGLLQQDSLLSSYVKNLNRLDSVRQQKQKNNELADTVNTGIKKYIDGTTRQIDTIIQQNTVLINGTAVSKKDLEKLNAALSFTTGAAQKIYRKVTFLEDLITRNMVVRLDQDVLFEPGSYKVSKSVVENIGKLFSPAALEIDNFSKKYSDFTLSLVITLKGYADATTIGEGSSLYNNLRERLLSLSSKEPDAKELNKELSRARAEEVKKLFEKYADSRNDNGIYRQKIIYIYEGKGEQLPDPKITDYRVDDPRRRIVLLFWSIFPD